VGFLRLAAAALAAVVCLGACGHRAGIVHRVEPGETLWRICRAYGLPASTILEANGLPGPDAVRPGRDLFIPGARERARVPGPVEYRDAILASFAGGGLSRPVDGFVASGFGGRGGASHRGVDIVAPEGTPVRAALAGTVIYAGDSLRGYGNAVVLDHGQGLSTLYGHLRELRVQSGEVVPAGSVVGTVGRTGNASTPHLHFELRVEGEAVDPERYLEGGDGRRWRR